jgi:hypothetical protein
LVIHAHREALRQRAAHLGDGSRHSHRSAPGVDAGTRGAVPRAALKKVRRRECRYLLRSNLTDTDPAKLWEFYLQLSEVENAFKELKGDLAIRPIHHQNEERIEAHIFDTFGQLPAHRSGVGFSGPQVRECSHEFRRRCPAIVEEF